MKWFWIIGLFVSVSAVGQAPGYMGKKLLITGEVSFLNALFNPNHNMNSGLRNFAFNVRATTDLDLVIARNASIGLTFDVFATGMEYDWKTDRYSEQLVPTIDSSFGNARISGYGYGINYKIFKKVSKNGIAPVGNYVKFDLMLLDMRVRAFDKGNEKAHPFSTRFLTPVFSITFGQQRIFWDFLILRSGIQLGFVPLGISPYMQKLNNGIERDTQEQDLRANTNARLFSYYLINVNFGVGFLLPFRKRYSSSQ
ncbi:MAG: hypothetical protein JKX84_05230 [Flavobacteriales bacterium]|nr:hypothetical protein [Flavobacteriales bacterium]